MASSDQITALTPTAGPGMGAALYAVKANITLATGDLEAADVHQLMDLPAGFQVVGGYVKASDMDTDGTPAVLFDIGVSGAVDTFWADTTVGQAGTVSQALAAAGFGYTTTAKTRVILTVATAPDVAAAGTLECVLFGLLQNPA